jgi:hypothetical protein
MCPMAENRYREREKRRRDDADAYRPHRNLVRDIGRRGRGVLRGVRACAHVISFDRLHSYDEMREQFVTASRARRVAPS